MQRGGERNSITFDYEDSMVITSASRELISLSRMEERRQVSFVSQLIDDILDPTLT